MRYAEYLLTPVVITAMPATRRNSASEPRSAAPYSLLGASRPQLTALTVAALKSHLKHFKLLTTGKKSELVDRLHSHLHADSTNDPQVTHNSNSQQNVPPQDVPVNAYTDAEPHQNVPTLSQQFHDGNVPTLPQQFLDQLTTILQQATNSTRGGAIHSAAQQPEAIEDDRLSAASLQVTSNPPLPTQVLTTCPSTQVNPPCSSGVTTLLPTPSLPQPTLPPIPARIKEKIARGEYIDFTALLPKSMFGAPEPQFQTLTLQLSSSGDNYSIRSPTTTANRKITSFAVWMEAWNVYIAVRMSINLPVHHTLLPTSELLHQPIPSTPCMHGLAMT